MTNTIIKAMALLAVTGSLTFGQSTANDAELTDAQMEEFLLNAEVVRNRGIGVGINQTRRLTLRDGDFEHDAHLNTVDEYKMHVVTQIRNEVNFKDTYKFNIAAYRLDRMVGLNMVPVTVERKTGRDTGSVAWWVDNAMMETERAAKKIAPPDPQGWVLQMFQARIFNELIYNTDANAGNYLLTEDGNVWLVDFTRAFRVHNALYDPQRLATGRIERRVYEGMKGLTEERLTQEMEGYLTSDEIRGLLARRDKIIEFFDQQIEEKGEAAVICDEPGH